MTKFNLNNLKIKGSHGSDFSLNNHNGIFQNINVEVYFRELENAIISKINEADYIFGCVAWLTNFKILKALSNCETFIIVQKEDFLRPDAGIKSKKVYKEKLRSSYNSLSCNLNSHLMQNKALQIIGGSYGFDFVEPIRCVGMTSKLNKSIPRMHNKFIIFCKNDDYNFVEPYAVWTGSFNFTKNAIFSFENAIYINDKKVADRYFEEFGQIAALSEPLDWETEYIKPEWEEAFS
ncbi:hypothetical protein JWG40_15485 [Leptospira sp. 201903074]|uniref:phospholipase D-like domain-containing protein n=1 Tax=Leptospira abararensis TaxID=2810036 RepID=UPI001963EA75|nr:phospholipase D-like domain-containing protein [Leptospira abararensis]MBM9548429.1 hypothetical protein [Leptospira abararensis]